MITWAEKVKIWDLRYLKNTPIDRIRQELEAGLNDWQRAARNMRRRRM